MRTSVRRSLATIRSVVRFDRVETDPVERRLARAASVADLRRIARRRMPRGCFDYIDGAAEDERTMAANAEAFARTTFRPRVLRGLSHVDVATTLLGEPVAYPLVLAPTGFTRIADPRGELGVARAAARAGLPYTLSTLGTRSIEEVRQVSNGRLWFQVYAWRDRALVEEMIARAAAADYEALVLTVDTAVFGRRERDVRRGFSLPPKIGPSTVADGLLHPGWTWAFLRNEPIMFANVIGRHVGDGSSPVTLADYINSQFDPTLSWADIEWLRSVWNKHIVVKGIQTVDDAVIAADLGELGEVGDQALGQAVELRGHDPAPSRARSRHERSSSSIEPTPRSAIVRWTSSCHQPSRRSTPRSPAAPSAYR
jgi:L-lactate dehydrogenase (cytochrome)